MLFHPTTITYRRKYYFVRNHYKHAPKTQSEMKWGLVFWNSGAYALLSQIEFTKWKTLKKSWGRMRKQLNSLTNVIAHSPSMVMSTDLMSPAWARTGPGPWVRHEVPSKDLDKSSASPLFFLADVAINALLGFQRKAMHRWAGPRPFTFIPGPVW
jgi:hypothetical protein